MSIEKFYAEGLVGLVVFYTKVVVDVVYYAGRKFLTVAATDDDGAAIAVSSLGT